jgi:hypothetical protein
MQDSPTAGGQFVSFMQQAAGFEHMAFAGSLHPWSTQR